MASIFDIFFFLSLVFLLTRSVAIYSHRRAETSEQNIELLHINCEILLWKLDIKATKPHP